MKKLVLLFVLSMCMTTFSVSAASKNVTLFLVGDATMADNTDLDASPLRGWGQLLPTFLSGNVVVENHARPGYSTRTLLAGDGWTSLLARVHRGDIVLVQLGENDMNDQNELTHTSVEFFETNLIQIVKQASKKGAKVVLATPVSHCFFANGVLRPRLGLYPEAVRRVARYTNVPCVDIEAATAAWLAKQGWENSENYYMPDGVTLREEGALLVGRLFSQEVKAKKIKPLSKLVFPDATEIKYSNPCLSK